MLNGIIKRDGRVVMYDISKIKMAILKAMEASGSTDFDKADLVTQAVESHFNNQNMKNTPTVEEIQDQVEYKTGPHFLCILERVLSTRIKTR